MASHTIALPIELYSTTEKTLLYSPFPTDTCCSQELIFKNHLATIDLTKCGEDITCSRSPDFRKEIIPTKCIDSIPLKGGCAKKCSDGSNITGSINCICTETNIVCPNRLYDKNDLNCQAMHDSLITNDDEIVFIKSDRPEVMNKTLKLAKIQVSLCSIEPEDNVYIDKIELKNNNIWVFVENAMNQECKVYAGTKSCRFVCMEKSCRQPCSISPDDSNENQFNVKVNCGKVSKELWLFRSHRVYTHNEIESHSSWRTHSKLYGTLLLLDLAFGYVFFRVILSVLYFSFIFIYNFSYKYGHLLLKYILGYTSYSDDICHFCKSRTIDIFDAVLHDENCNKSTCPYCSQFCRSELELSEHIHVCDRKSEARSIVRAELKEQAKEMAKMHKNLAKRMLWKNQLTMRKIPTKLWIVSVIILITLTMISPSSALMSKPCTRLIGHTTGCNEHIHPKGLKVEAKYHAHYSAMELGMLDRIERKYMGDEFVTNAIHRLKTNHILAGNTAQAMTTTVDKTLESGTMLALANVDWAGSVQKGNIQSMKTDVEGKLETTMNIFIADVEALFELELQYKTTEWQSMVTNGFDCTNPDCNEVCKRDETNKCPAYNRSKSYDSSWNHNPSWCLTINQGCTCVIAQFSPKPDAPIYEIYKTGQGVLRALICLEMNSLYIYCDVVDKPGTYMLDKTKMMITSWKLSYKPEDVIIVERNQGSNLKIDNAKTGFMCPKESCELGHPGDFQFSIYDHKCAHSAYLSTDIVKSNVHYAFASTPQWEVITPSPGSNRIKRYPPLTTNKDTHSVNVNEGTLKIDEGQLGEFSMKLEIANIEIYDIKDECEISDFKVYSCMGEFMSEIGVICTFQLNLRKCPKTNIRIVSNDDSSFVQSDMQTITEGMNNFRKFMYVRSRRTNYHFCVDHKSERQLCTSIPYNLTEPNHVWRILPTHSSITNKNAIPKECDQWFGINCMFRRVIDFFRTAWSGLWFFIIGIVLLVVIKLLFQFINSKKNEMTGKVSLIEIGDHRKSLLNHRVQKHMKKSELTAGFID